VTRAVDREARRRRERRGRSAETLAAWRLRLAGYRVVERRLRTPVGEIDIVAVRGRILVLVEVKARAESAEAAELVGPRQRRRLERAAAWLQAHRPHLAGHAVRFDLMLVRPLRIPVHVADAWRPEWPQS
jgi:putative endonuclease